MWEANEVGLVLDLTSNYPNATFLGIPSLLLLPDTFKSVLLFE